MGRRNLINRSMKHIAAFSLFLCFALSSLACNVLYNPQRVMFKAGDTAPTLVCSAEAKKIDKELRELQFTVVNLKMSDIQRLEMLTYPTRELTLSEGEDDGVHSVTVTWLAGRHEWANAIAGRTPEFRFDLTLHDGSKKLIVVQHNNYLRDVFHLALIGTAAT